MPRKWRRVTEPRLRRMNSCMKSSGEIGRFSVCFLDMCVFPLFGSGGAWNRKDMSSGGIEAEEDRLSRLDELALVKVSAVGRDEEVAEARNGDRIFGASSRGRCGCVTVPLKPVAPGLPWRSDANGFRANGEDRVAWPRGRAARRRLLPSHRPAEASSPSASSVAGQPVGLADEVRHEQVGRVDRRPPAACRAGRCGPHSSRKRRPPSTRLPPGRA